MTPVHRVAIPTICAAICCCCCCFSSSLVASSPATLSHFQISVCRGMCQFRADDLVFVFVFSFFFFFLFVTHTYTRRHARTHRRTNGERAPLHASPLCQHCKNSPYYPSGCIWFLQQNHRRSGFGKCQFWNRLIFNYGSSTADCHFI